MKKIYHNIWLACAAVALSLVACTADDGPTVDDEPAVVYPELHFSVSDMTTATGSRASDPMNPDEEKYIKTIALFEFDNEGLHYKGNNTYHFIDFTAGTVDGATGVGDVKKAEFGVTDTKLSGIAFNSYDNGVICVVVNVTEDQVADFYDEYREPGESYGFMTFDKFKTWHLRFEYMEIPEGVYDESTVGHLKYMYMFGYYEGPVDPAKSGDISVTIGRLASRIDMTIVNETGMELDKRLGYHFDNVCNSAYLFPFKMGMPPTIGAGLSRTVICSGDEPVEGDTKEYNIVPRTFPAGASHTRYFYAAAHSAEGYDDATKLHLFYNRKIVHDDTSDYSNSVWVPLCNVHPSEADNVINGYSLSRNTRYHFTIHLKKKDSAPSGAPTSRSVEYGEHPGDITVYLP